jgi:hypothetical protein
MKTAKLALIIAGCAAIPAFAQSGSPQCGVTNFDRARALFTITNPSPGSVNQQCFVTVVSKAEWSGGMPDFSTSQIVEGNYEISASGGGGGAGGAARSARGYDGADAMPFKRTVYLSPGVYRLTIGAGGQGGQAFVTEDQGGRGGDGAPTSISEAYAGQTLAGYPRAESWDGRYPVQVASGRRVRGDDASTDGNMTPAARSGDLGGGARGGDGVGARGGNGFIKLAFADPIPQARAADQAAPSAAAPAATSVTPAAPAPTRPARKDRN